jgi:hypothetical protein
MADELCSFIARIIMIEDDTSLYDINICMVRTCGDDILSIFIDKSGRFSYYFTDAFFLMSNFPKG